MLKRLRVLHQVDILEEEVGAEELDYFRDYEKLFTFSENAPCPER